mgnify:CR=1 FL=1
MQQLVSIYKSPILICQNLKTIITMQKRFTQLLVVLFIMMSQQVFAQDMQFSQFYASPMNLNPAMTGVFEGDFRAVVNYREQYNSILDIHPFRTISAGFEKRFRIPLVCFRISVLHLLCMVCALEICQLKLIGLLFLHFEFNSKCLRSTLPSLALKLLGLQTLLTY